MNFKIKNTELLLKKINSKFKLSEEDLKLELYFLLNNINKLNSDTNKKKEEIFIADKKIKNLELKIKKNYNEQILNK